ncbi:amidoligase family protein [Sporanaerobacter acetigenes]|uniref:amidoligase family protein n=1 Tax=Sporanaerobacter acetigenes TaxID=165813 RepID=UPI003331CF05
MADRDFLKTNFGIETELTGITREKAARVVADHLRGSIQRRNDYYDSYKITALDGRAWKIMYDGSLRTQRKVNGQKVTAGRNTCKVSLFFAF